MAEKQADHTHTFTVKVTSYGPKSLTKRVIAEALARAVHLNFGDRGEVVGFHYDPAEKDHYFVKGREKEQASG